MDRKIKALDTFLKREAKEASDRFILFSAEHMKKNEMAVHVQEMAEDFGRLFQICGESNEEVCFVQIVLLRSQALAGNPFYILEAYGKDFYLSEPVGRVELRLEWLYTEYKKFCREIYEQSKKYVMCFTESELNRIRLTELINCRRIVRHLFEESIVDIINTEEYQQLGLREGFQIHMAEYRGPYEKIFEKDEYTDKIGRLWYGILQNNAKEKV